MNKLTQFFTVLLFSSWTLHADFCQEISQELSTIFDQTEELKGKFHQVVPFPDQGGSFINQVYLIYTDSGEMLVLKVENTRWKSEKTLNEVSTLNCIRDHFSIPVPKVIAYENAINCSLLEREYILMEHIKGTPFNHLFDKIYSSPTLYRRILEQLADVLAQLRKQPLTGIGSIKDEGGFALKCPMDFANQGYDTACSSFSEYAQRWLLYYIQEMKTLKDSGHKNRVYFEKYIPLAENLLSSFDWPSLDLPSEPFFFSHQDFVMKNILIDGERVAAVLDWEWSGTAPSEFESKTGCDFLKTKEDIAFFDSLLEERGVSNFFTPPTAERQRFYELMGNLYSLISCYEWIEGKLEHSAKFLDQKLEQRRIRNSKNFDMESYVEEIANSLNNQFRNYNET